MTDDDLLDLLHRERLRDVAEVAARARIEHDQAHAALARLAEAGHLSMHEGVILLNAPAQAAAIAIERLLRAEREAAAARSAQVAAVVDGLARRTAAWSFGESVVQERLSLQTAHGPQAAEDLWFAVQASRPGPGGAVHAVLTDVDRYRRSTPERSGAFARAMASYSSVQAIIPTMELDDQLITMVGAFRDAGVQFRMLPDPPSWFWVDDEDVTGLPYQWGDRSPQSVVAVTSPVLAALARECFALLWRQAQPVGADPAGYGAILQRMRGGMTLDAASRSLGITPRTGRRRISVAMQRYGVATLFALGVAWAEDGSPGATPRT